MKKSKKCDFKKLALLGIAGGTVLATQAAADNLNNFSEMLAFNNCGSQNGCEHGGGSRNMGGNGGSYYYQAYRNAPSQETYYQSQPSSSCSASSYSQGQYYQPSQPSSGCGASPGFQGGRVTAMGQSPQSSQPYSQSQTQPGQWQQGQTPQGQMQPRQWQQGQTQPDQWQQGQTQPGQWQQGQMESGQMQRTSPSAANQRGTYSQWETGGYTSDASKPNTQRTLTESELLSQLNDQGKTTYQSLDSAGKALALKIANQDCKAQNECKGLNSCKTEDHACAGKGSCAGTAKANFKDKNLAVKVAALKMAEKRANAASSKY